mmetsp:Transcript_43944/g.74093  ORF Transcript_43944/g.74093 Transcript_43944/m.74093 type:complete len:214 (+) Transcript_43944:190-831(+)
MRGDLLLLQLLAGVEGCGGLQLLLQQRKLLPVAEVVALQFVVQLDHLLSQLLHLLLKHNALHLPLLLQVPDFLFLRLGCLRLMGVCLQITPVLLVLFRIVGPGLVRDGRLPLHVFGIVAPQHPGLFGVDDNPKVRNLLSFLPRSLVLRRLLEIVIQFHNGIKNDLFTLRVFSLFLQLLLKFGAAHISVFDKLLVSLGLLDVFFPQLFREFPFL